MKRNHIVLDCETGGLSCFQNPITEIALQVLSNKDLSVLFSYETYIKPYGDMEIEKEALEHSQTTMSEVNAGAEYKAVLKVLVTTFDKYTIRTSKAHYKPVLVAHNADFDAGFLEVLFALDNKDLYDYLDKVLFCTQREQERIDGYIEDKKAKLKYTLGNCCERMGIELKNAHGAMPDVLATTELFIAQIAKMQGGSLEATKVKKTKTTKARQFFNF